tara:strand:- start:1315 stop:2820 length:1506 start_codon:yes stop_codon:yes gene_type:complete
MSETKETEKKHDPKKPMFYQITQDNKRVTLDQMQDNSLDNPLWDDFDEVVISTKYILDTLIQYWPNGKKNLTKEIQNKLIGKIMRCMPNEEALRKQIKDAWEQRDKLMSKEMLEKLHTRRQMVKSKSSTKQKTTKKTARLTGNTLKQRFQAVKDQVAQETTKVISPATPMLEPKRFQNFRLNQGNIGICYMVAVIVLFQNEFSILHKLNEIVNSEEDQGNKVDQTIKDLVTFLDNNYRYTSFNNKCPKKFLPKLPKTWQKSVHQTDNIAKKRDIVSGGDTAFLLTFIFAKLDAWHDSFNVAFDYDYMSDDVVRMTKTEKGASFDYNDTTNMTMFTFAKMVDKFEKDKKHNIALIEMTFGNNAQEQLTVGDANPFKMVDNMARLPTVRGFIVRVSAGIGEDGHVVAGTVDNVSGKVPQEVVYCNSWGEKKGCDDSDTINTGLMKVNDQFKITTIHFVLRKQNFDFRNIERNISSSGEDSSDDPDGYFRHIFSSDEDDDLLLM